MGPGRHIVLPLLVVGALAGMVMAEVWRWRPSVPGEAIATWLLTVTLALGCAGVGAIGVGALSRLDRTALRWVVVVGVVGATVAFVVVSELPRELRVHVTWLVALMGPGLVMLTLSALRPRARAGSLLARARDRRHWCMVGGVAYVDIGMAAPELLSHTGDHVILLAAWVTASTLGGCTLSSAYDLRRARRACAEEEGSLEPVVPGQVSVRTAILDVGVGERMAGKLTLGDRDYRECPEVTSVLVGDWALGLSRLARSHDRLIGCCCAVVLIPWLLWILVIPMLP